MLMLALGQSRSAKVQPLKVDFQVLSKKYVEMLMLSQFIIESLQYQVKNNKKFYL